MTQISASKIQCVSFISLGLAINIGVCQILKTKPSTSPNSPSKRLRYILSSLWGENRKKCLVFVKLVNCVGRRIHKIPNDSGIEKMEEMDRILIWEMRNGSGEGPYWWHRSDIPRPCPICGAKSLPELKTASFISAGLRCK